MYTALGIKLCTKKYKTRHLWGFCFFFNLQFADRTVAMSAIDMTSLLLEVSAPMKQLYPSMPSKVLEALCYAIAGATMCIPHSHNLCVCVLQL